MATGTAAGGPAAVEGFDLHAAIRRETAGFGLHVGDVQARVVHADDLSAHFDGVGDEHRVREELCDACAQQGFAVARRAVEQHGAAGADGGHEALHRLVRQHEAGEGFAQGGYVENLVGDRLLADLRLEGSQADRCRTHVLGLLHRLAGGDAAVVAECVADVAHDAAVDGAEHVDKLLGDRVVDDLLDDGVRQVDAMGELGDGFARCHAHEFQDHAKQQPAADAGFGHCARHDGRLVHHGEQLFGGHQPERDQVVAEAAAFHALALDGRVDVRAEDHTAHEKDVTKPHGIPLGSKYPWNAR